MGADNRRLTWILAAVTLTVLVAASPGALRDAFERGGLYLFSTAFLEDLPRRLTGPGRFRFVFQPLVAILLGSRAGVADARAGRPPYVLALALHREHRGEMFVEGFRHVINLVLMGILLDAVSQWLILGVSHPFAAIVVGPVLIAAPYTVARALANRVSRARASLRTPGP